MNRLFQWRRLWSKEPVQVRVVDVPVTKLRADEFRANKELVHLAAQVLANPNTQIMLSVLRNEHPGHDVLTGTVSPNDRLVQQGRAEGYEICLSTFEALGKEQALAERLEATFGASQQAVNT